VPEAVRVRSRLQPIKIVGKSLDGPLVGFKKAEPAAERQEKHGHAQGDYQSPAPE